MFSIISFLVTTLHFIVYKFLNQAISLFLGIQIIFSFFSLRKKCWDEFLGHNLCTHLFFLRIHAEVYFNITV